MNPGSAIQLLRTMGPEWVFWRGLYETMLRTGVQERRFPPTPPETLLAREFGVPQEDLYATLHERWTREGQELFVVRAISKAAAHVAEPKKVIQAADGAAQGRFPFFSHGTVEVGNPVDWLRNPVSGTRYPADRHWTRIPDISPELGDIKYVWELSRGAQIYLYVRAAALTKDSRYAEAFWHQVDAWIAANPYQMGPNWRCGQEAALRSFAWIFGLYAFRDAAPTTPERVGRLIAVLWAHALRIERNHWYAVRCVRNNHALSEAAGMYTIGTLFPFLPGADRWRRAGRESFEREASWQIYPDGTYVQHSTNYARLVVQLFNWVLSLNRNLAGEAGLSRSVLTRAKALLEFLWSIQDDSSGQVPNYGSNDGALIFPLSSCDYLDYRPSLNALNLLLEGERLYKPGPWNEEAAWFGLLEDSPSGGIAVTASRPLRVSSAFETGGYYVLRGADQSACVRCGSYRDRPAQADMLHVDYWYRGYNVFTDPGTYSYNTSREWQQYFLGTGAHNTVTVDGRDQMTKGDRFIWLNWVHGVPLRFEQDGNSVIFQGEHSAYAPVIHRRTVTLRDGKLTVVDELTGDHALHTFRLHWLVGGEVIERGAFGGVVALGDGSERVTMLTTCTSAPGPGVHVTVVGSWAHGEADPPRGWRSLYYGVKEPVWSYSLDVTAPGPVRFVTVVEPMVGEGRTLDLEDPANVDDVMTTFHEASGVLAARSRD